MRTAGRAALPRPAVAFFKLFRLPAMSFSPPSHSATHDRTNSVTNDVTASSESSLTGATVVLTRCFAIATSDAKTKSPGDVLESSKSLGGSSQESAPPPSVASASSRHTVSSRCRLVRHVVAREPQNLGSHVLGQCRPDFVQPSQPGIVRDAFCTTCTGIRSAQSVGFL